MSEGRFIPLADLGDTVFCHVRGIRDQFADSDVPICLGSGIHAGERIVEDADLQGESLMIAKRLASAGPPDGILVSDGVRHLLAGEDVAFTDRSAIALPGCDEPVRARSLAWV